MNETVRVLMEYNFPREVAEKIYWMSSRGQFRANRILPFESVSEFAIGVRINPLSYLDGNGIDIFQGISHNTFIGFVFSKKKGCITIAWGGIYEDTEDPCGPNEYYERAPMTDEQREAGISLSNKWIKVAREELNTTYK
jgi:hypothetical protein